jgi:STE24 endopeptidase
LSLILVVIGTHAAARLVDWLGVDGWGAQLVVIVVALQTVSLVYDVPLDWWVDLVHDRKWELSTQTSGGFVADQVKTFVLGVVLGVAVLLPLYALVRSTDLWWLWGWLLLVGFSVGLGLLFPVVIAPLFNRFDPLPPGELADRVDAVADLAGVRITGTFVADESRRSRRDNAYVAGLGSTRRVVLFDTLLEQPTDVVEQVVAHELGHWRRHHLRVQVVVAAALGLVVFLLLRAASSWTGLLDWAGLDPSAAFGDPASLPLVLLVAQVGFVVTGLAGAAVSRAFERQADLEALDLLRRPDRVIEMHRRIHVKNLADLDPPWLRRLQRTHPPPAERMAFAAAWDDGRTT